MVPLAGGKMGKKKFITTLLISLIVLFGVIILNTVYAIFDVKYILLGATIGYIFAFVSKVKSRIKENL